KLFNVSKFCTPTLKALTLIVLFVLAFSAVSAADDDFQQEFAQIQKKQSSRLNRWLCISIHAQPASSLQLAISMACKSFLCCSCPTQSFAPIILILPIGCSLETLSDRPPPLHRIQVRSLV